MADTPHLNQHIRQQCTTKNYRGKSAREEKLHALCVLIFSVWRVDEISGAEPFGFPSKLRTHEGYLTTKVQTKAAFWLRDEFSLEGHRSVQREKLNYCCVSALK